MNEIQLRALVGMNLKTALSGKCKSCNTNTQLYVYKGNQEKLNDILS